MIAQLLAIAMSMSPVTQDQGGSMKAVGETMNAWKLCAATRVRHYATTTQEPAQTVVDAAIGHCQDEFLEVRSALFSMKFTVEEATKTLDSLLTTFRQTLLAGVLDLREADQE